MIIIKSLVSYYCNKFSKTIQSYREFMCHRPSEQRTVDIYLRVIKTDIIERNILIKISLFMLQVPCPMICAPRCVEVTPSAVFTTGAQSPARLTDMRGNR